MAIYITATWKVTLGALVILDNTDMMLEEPRIQRAPVVQMRQFIGSDYAKPVGRKLVTHVAQLTQVRVFATDADARSFLITHTKAMPKGAVTCTIRRKGEGADDTLANTVATIDATCESNLFIARYVLTGGELT